MISVYAIEYAVMDLSTPMKRNCTVLELNSGGIVIWGAENLY